ncbi:MDR/zinc-dependent alcohol dehydrogenase-like family protein [Nonomuraea jabiensis]|uniref:hypothetical protein n=1 Tax=Nonomuraea jabiensis TaxID=882448 RepID=UPI0036776DF9
MAEYAVVTVGDYLAKQPDALSLEASALPGMGMTGLAVVEAGEFESGEKVLVIGAGGSLGSVVVPMPTGRVEVIATAAGEDGNYVRMLGAGSSIDYLAADVTVESLCRHPGGVDTIINLALRGEPLIGAGRAIRPGGRLLSTTSGTPEQSEFGREDLSVTVVYRRAEGPEPHIPRHRRPPARRHAARSGR